MENKKYLFGIDVDTFEPKSKTNFLVYDPTKKSAANNPQQIVNAQKYYKLLNELEKSKSNLSDDFYKMMKLACTRLIQFNYSEAAAYYKHFASDEEKSWMEKLNLVLIDKKSAVQNDYDELSDSIIELFNL